MKKSVFFLLSLFTTLFMEATEFSIVKAIYGSPEKTADVTENLRKHSVVIPGKLLAFIVDNKTLGADPDPGKLKYLTLSYTENGQQKIQQIRERHHCVLIPGTTASDKFQIHGAYYGNGSKWTDVTDKIRNACVDACVDNYNFGPDPCPGKTKNLLIIYSWKKELKIVHFRENQIFRHHFPR